MAGRKDGVAKRARDQRTKIPVKLQKELDGAGSGTGGGGGEGLARGVTRKEARKEARKGKKRGAVEARAAWVARRKGVEVGAAEKGSVAEKGDAAEGGGRAKKVRFVEEEVVKLERGGKAEKKSKKKKKRKRAEPVPAPPLMDDDEHDVDAKEIRRLEKLLGISKRKKKKAAKGNSFSYRDAFGEDEDDMAGLLDFCDARRGAGGLQHGDCSSEVDSDERSGSEMSDDDRSVASREMLDSSDSSGSGPDEECGPDLALMSSGDDSDDDAVVNEKPGVVPKAAAQVTPPQPRSGSKYVPPGAQGNGAPRLRVTRRIRGLLNRLALANASGIADDLLRLFQGEGTGLSRRELADVYASVALDGVKDGSGAVGVNPYVASHAAIMTHLGARIDPVVLAAVVVIAMRRIVAGLEALTASNVATDDCIDARGYDAQNRDLFGYAALLCCLYERGAVASQMVYDLVRVVAETLGNERVELLLMMLRQVGTLLRADDPVALKDMIEFVQGQAAAAEADGGDSKLVISSAKVQVMLDLIYDIKNNKLKKSTVRENAARFPWAASLGKPLSASVRDLCDEGFTDMRWWEDGILGLSKLERSREGATVDKGGVTSNYGGSAAVYMDGDDKNEPDLSSLAVSLRLNTDYRKALFTAIMSSTSVSDAYERIERLGGFEAKKGHDRDAARVILHCCGAERNFNPFYALIAERMCKRSRNARFTFEFALWDTFKSMPGSDRLPPMSERKANNYAQLLGRLLINNTLQLSVLRQVADFEECSPIEVSVYSSAIEIMFRGIAEDGEGGNETAIERLASESWNGASEFRTAFALFLRRAVRPRLPRDIQARVTRAIRVFEKQY